MSEKITITGVDTNLISDGYHTFGELYEHRIELWIALCRMMALRCMRTLDEPVDLFYVWKSRLHSDGSKIDGWFVLGLREKVGRQITYHLPDSYWEVCNFAHTRDTAPEFDGHTSSDVLKSLRSI